MASEVDLDSVARSIDAIDQELKGALQETKSIETRVQSVMPREIPQIDPFTHTTQKLLEDGTSEAYDIHIQQR